MFSAGDSCMLSFVTQYLTQDISSYLLHVLCKCKCNCL